MSGQRLTEFLEIVDGEIRCRRCSQVLAPAGKNYKEGCVMRELPLTEANPQLRDPGLYVDNEVVFRHLYCPGCATLLQTELAIDGEPPQWDVRLEV